MATIVLLAKNSVIMYGVKIPDNTIVAAGSVVTKSVSESFKIIGGNPAKIIGDWDSYREKYKENAITRGELHQRLVDDDSFLVKRSFM